MAVTDATTGEITYVSADDIPTTGTCAEPVIATTQNEATVAVENSDGSITVINTDDIETCAEPTVVDVSSDATISVTDPVTGEITVLDSGDV